MIIYQFCRFYSWFCSIIARNELMTINWSNLRLNLDYFEKVLKKKISYLSLQRSDLDDSICSRKIKKRSPTFLLIKFPILKDSGWKSSCKIKEQICSNFIQHDLWSVFRLYLELQMMWFLCHWKASAKIYNYYFYLWRLIPTIERAIEPESW